MGVSVGCGNGMESVIFVVVKAGAGYAGLVAVNVQQRWCCKSLAQSKRR
jgi:hypothetical protein